MRCAPLVLLAMALPLSLEAQNFTGSWQAPNRSGGVITLALTQRGRQVTGTLSGNGNSFAVRGQVDDDGVFEGQASSAEGSLPIEAEIDGGTLQLMLGDNELEMRRVSGAAAAPPARGAQPGVAQSAPAPARSGRGTDSYSGTFSNGELTITLRRAGQGYQGQATTQGQTYPVQAQMAGDRISGMYVAEGQQLPFEAMVQGDQMQLAAGGQTYLLQRGAGGQAQRGGSGAGGAAGGGPGRASGGLAASPQDQQIVQLLLSSPWCSFRYSQTMGTTSTERVVFTRDGQMVMGSNRETQMSNPNGQYYGSSSGGDRSRWRVQNGMLMLSQDGATWEATPLSIARNSNGYPIVTANGKEYSQCN